MVDRLITFGEEGAEGPAGTVNVPGGRGILAYANGNVFGVPESVNPGDVVTVGPGGAFTFAPLRRLPEPGVGDDGKIVRWVEGAGVYLLTDQLSEFPIGGPGVVGKTAAGDPTLFPFAAAPEGAFARRVGDTLGFSQLFTANGYVKAQAGGGFSYTSIGNGLLESAGVLSVDPDTGIVVTASGVGIDTAVVAQVSGGVHLASQARGKTLVISDIQSSSNISIASNVLSAGNMQSFLTPALGVGDELQVDFVFVCAHTSGTTTTSYYVCQVDILNPASAVVATFQAFASGPMGRVMSAFSRWSVLNAGQHRIRMSCYKFDVGTATTNFNSTARYNVFRT